MTDINHNYKNLANQLNRSRKTLWEVCQELSIDFATIDDHTLEQHVQECAHCGVWGTQHRRDEDGFFVCNLCYKLVGR
jgi:alpha-D-ribose 1-methylphosphonate 5-triphosphate diphosphatase PhnM